MKVIFIKDLSGQGRKGEIKEAKNGFAQNFLIAKGYAQIVTPQMIAKLEKENKEQEEKRQKTAAKLQSLKADLEKRVFTLRVKVGEQGQVFGGVHEKDVVNAVNKVMNSDFDKNQVEIPNVIKQLGEHAAKLKLGAFEANLTIRLEAE